MLKYRRIIQDSARRVADAASRTVGDYVAHEVEEETDFTSEMLGRMKESMQDYWMRGVRWTAKTLTSHRRDAQETEFGADFIGVVSFDFPDYKVSKGFLAQAKRIEPGAYIRPDDWERMVTQCKKMLSITPESFVFLYSYSAITIAPATAIISARRHCNPHEFYSRTITRFYEDHFECFVGDLQIHSADIRTLEELRARHSIHFCASTDE
jgi:hypothetical protein